MWLPPKSILDQIQRSNNNNTLYKTNRRSAGNKIYVVPLTAVALAVLVVASRANARNITPYEADLNKNQLVNFVDYSILANNWAQQGPKLPGDFNKDKIVNIEDLASITSHWLGTWTPIATVQDLNDVRKDLEGCYALVADVNAYDTATWNGGQGFEPIGPFTGSFFGGGHSIIGLTIIRSFDSNLGLFSYLDSDALVSDIRLNDVYISGSSALGPVAGTVANGTIQKVASSGIVVAGDRRAGGIVGVIHQGTILDCLSECDVTTGLYYLGGVAGDAELLDPNSPGIYFINCRSSGNITGVLRRIGGLIGRVVYSNVSNCYSTSKVTGDSRVGGLIGENRDDSSTIIDSYFTDPNHPYSDPNFYGIFEPNGPTAFHGNSHPVYATWDFNDVWLADPNNFPTLREQEETSAMYDSNNIQSNNIPTQMRLKQPKDLVEITKALARKEADHLLKAKLKYAT